ncbi:MAG: S-methyl-5-thioribose-1-phosphate isomerase [Chloroflexota bacterium]|nr:S-methyl-5-thioribose-1-phosphate isomerase [Chloroflexota bacterium]MDE2683809.1 S-methyl-5-thioribose-1-phosphate isomerase [Chloroflexota bacterium]
MTEIRPINWTGSSIQLLDQTLLPHQHVTVTITDYRAAAAAITEMRVRGAPAIGVTAAYAVVLAAAELQSRERDHFIDALRQAGAHVAAARPTAVNLGWAVRRMLRVADAEPDPGSIRPRLEAEARRIQEEDENINRRIGENGRPLMPPDGQGVLTHCNTGALATSAFGTALGVIRAGWEAGGRFRVFNTETRPWLQGARLTSWEFQQLGIPATLVADSAAGILMQRGEVSCVITGADRVAANGDTANKIGTYSLAVLAHENGIPFYIAAPTSTVDLAIAHGDNIAIEERPEHEVTGYGGARIAPEGTPAYNPAFDVTPHRYIAGIVTEAMVCRPPYTESLQQAVDAA